MTDRDGAMVILAVKNAAAELVRGLHAREGAALLRRVHDAEQQQIRSIVVAIGRVLCGENPAPARWRAGGFRSPGDRLHLSRRHPSADTERADP
jgi:hypothetical protein